MSSGGGREGGQRQQRQGVSRSWGKSREESEGGFELRRMLKRKHWEVEKGRVEEEREGVVVGGKTEAKGGEIDFRGSSLFV